LSIGWRIGVLSFQKVTSPRCRPARRLPADRRPATPAQAPFDTLLADKGCSSEDFRQACRERGTQPIISQSRTAGIKGLGKLRDVVEQTFALLHQFRRLAVRWERRLDTHDGLVGLAWAMICWCCLIEWTEQRSY
jgi:transposase